MLFQCIEEGHILCTYLEVRQISERVYDSSKSHSKPQVVSHILLTTLSKISRYRICDNNLQPASD